MPLTVDVHGGLVQADTRTTMLQPPRLDDVCEKYNAGSMCSYAYISICRLVHIMH
jgi:hypothetical protein